MISPARKISFEILKTIDNGRAFSDDALNSPIMQTVDVRDRHLVTEIVYGTLRRQLLLDHVLAGASSRAWGDIDPGVKILLRISLYQCWFMDRVPDHAIVNDAVELAKSRIRGNAFRYLNGVLRHLTRSRPWGKGSFMIGAPGWIRVSLPEWLWQRWEKRYGAETAMQYSDSLNAPPQSAFRLGNQPDTDCLPFALDRSDLVPGAYIRKRSAAETAEMVSLDFPAQDEASQLVPHLLGDIRGEVIWDACAAPGGKTAILCANAGPSGRVVASDISKKRILRMRENLSCLGFKPEIVVADTGAAAPFSGCFDTVVADVPCSGLGTLRRNPEIKWRFLPSELLRLNKIQSGILESAAEKVRKGGRLLYSTCSTEPEENEFVIDSFLATHPDFAVERPSGPGGVAAWTGEDGCVRTFPSTRRWDGLFAALLRRHL